MIAVVLFAFQIYCDFGGYTNLARGAASIMGIRLMDNFRQPYLATSIRDFWRRWHISLTTWFTDYLYIPMGGNRKGIIRKYLNTIFVFAVSGLWHGASWNFVAWGLLHAVYQVVGDLRRKVRRRSEFKETGMLSKKLRDIITTFVLVDFAWIFFVSSQFRHALSILRQMAHRIMASSSLLDFGLDITNWRVLICAIIILIVVDVAHEKNVSLFEVVNRQEIWFRWILYLGLIWAVLVFGIFGKRYDTSTFIYFQF